MKTIEDKITTLSIKLDKLREQQRLEECQKVKTKLIENGFSFGEQYIEITSHNHIDILFFARIKKLELKSSSLVNVFYDWSIEVKNNSILIEKEYKKYYSIKEIERSFKIITKEHFEKEINKHLNNFKI